jgi:hypothetical protein
MAKRGKILRDPSAGPGLLMIDGHQHQFVLEGVWKSDAFPKPGLTVDVDLDQDGKITGITAVPESQLAKEQADAALKAAKEKGGEVLSQIVAKVGMPNLAAGAVLVISWLWLTAVSVQLPFLGSLEFTFWQVLGFLNSKNILDVMERHGHPSAGIYGFFAVVCMAAPFVHHFWKDKRSALGGAAPLVFMTIVGIMVRSSINNAMGGPGNVPSGPEGEELVKISMGMGVYLSALANLYFAGVGLKNYLAARAGADSTVVQKAAA